MDSLILKDFRCFAGLQEIPVRPLTLLVGENSSGKTSFLAAARFAEQMRISVGPLPDFNDEPFTLGTFDEIAHYKGGKTKHAEQFQLGSTFREKIEKGVLALQFVVEFREVNGRPAIKHFRLSHGNYELSFDFSGKTPQSLVRTPSRPKGIRLDGLQSFTDPPLLLRVGLRHLNTLLVDHPELVPGEGQFLASMARCWGQESARSPYAAGPVRAQPRRVYEPLSDTPTPQGDHFPVLFSQIYGHRQWEQLREPLEKFARASGLFNEIVVKRLGKTVTSPFQIQVKLGGLPHNLIDVGYGVSQILPIVVDLLRETRRRMYLIQQPEVHLHPRAQAELGTLLAALTRTHAKQLLVETHSDYIIDRLRMEVRGGTLKPADTVILYFERDRSEVTVHQIEVDENGNLLETPPSYRSFFLEEEGRFLGIADVHHH